MDCNPQLQSISIPTSRGAAASLDFPARRRANVFRHLQLQARKTDASHQIDQRARGVHSAARSFLTFLSSRYTLVHFIRECQFFYIC